MQVNGEGKNPSKSLVILSHHNPSLLSIVIPIHNERENVSPLTKQIVRVFSDAQEAYEIIYIDDASTDGSDVILDELEVAHDVVKVFHFVHRSGQTAAFSAGFKQARGNCIATLDGDLQYDPADILRLLPLSDKFDLVCGRRVTRNDNAIRGVSSRLANAVRNLVTHDQVQDTGCSLKIFSRQLIDRLQLFDGMHRFFPALAKMYGFTVTECDVRHFPRTHGTSKYGIQNRLWRGLVDLSAVWWMNRRCLRYEYRSATERQTKKESS